MKKCFVVLIMLMVLCANAFASNTVTNGQRTIGITPDGSTDWGGTDTYDVQWIIFKPSAANDVICILDGDGGPALLYATSIDGGNLMVQPWIKCKPFLDASACTFGTAANVRITIGYTK